MPLPINISNQNEYYKHRFESTPGVDLDPINKYQLRPLNKIIDQFIVAYVGEDKIIPKAKRTDISFHAQRALAELTFDTFKSWKSMEFVLPNSLQMWVPNDYVNYTKISWVDNSGIKHPLYPTSKTSNPKSQVQASNGEFVIKAVGTFTNGEQNVVLDGDYDNIITGMLATVVDGITSNVESVITTSGITTIKMGSPWGNASGDREIKFRLAGSKLIPKTEKTARITGSYTSGTATITAATGDGAKVEVGMFVIDDNIPHIEDPWSNSPKVIDVQGDIITINNNFSATGASVQINFISYRESDTWKNYKSTTPSENSNNDYDDDVYWAADGKRYGLDPQHAQINGSFFIDDRTGKIHFSSNLSGKTIVLDYISDSLASSNDELYVHKFAEEAMYRWILYAILSTRINIPENVVRRFKKEKFAEVRKAKLRLSNIKLEEITQILRGKSKQIKH